MYKLFKVLLFFSLIVFSVAYGTKNIFAQSCPSSVNVDKYMCQGYPDEFGNCPDPVYAGGQLLAGCSWNGFSCTTVGGICSSNDSCIPLNGNCVCTNSPVDCNNPGGGGGSTCSDPDWTAPQITSIDWSTGTGGKMKATIQFSDGRANNVSIGASSNWVSATGFCNPALGFTDGCVIYTGLGGNGTNVSSPLVVNGFTKGTVYYFGIFGTGPAGCSGQGNDKTDISSCEMTPDNLSFNIGGPSQTLTSEVVSTYVWGTNPADVKVTFSSSNTNVAGVNPASETNSYRYQTSVSPVGVGSARLRSSTYLDDVLKCNAYFSTVTVATTTPSCTLVLTPQTRTVTEGAGPITYTAAVTPQNGTIESVSFTSSNPNAATVTAIPDTISPYTKAATIASNVNSTQVTTIQATAKIAGQNIFCDDDTPSTLTVLDSPPVDDVPWWQVVDGDVTAIQGLVSDVPTSNVFIDDGDGGYPGVPVYGTSLNVGDGSTSSTNWNADTTTIQPRTFDYLYFENLIPDDVTLNDISKLSAGGATQSYGYEWYKVTGNLAIDDLLNLTSRKVILFVSGDLNINNEIFVTNGVGFFGTFVGGSIYVYGGITRAANPSIEGIYLTDEDFSTGAGTSKLWVRGSIVALGGFNLQRNLANDATPSEIFEFAPDQILLFPKELSFKRTKWTEVSP